MSTEVKGFKFTSGEEIVAEVVRQEVVDGEQAYVVRKPVVFMDWGINPETGEQEVGQQHLRAMKWIRFSNQDEFVVYEREVMIEPYTLWKELEDMYLQAVSGIALASAMPS